MRAGMEPQRAIDEVLRMMVRRRREALGDGQVAFLAVRRDGLTGAGCLRPGFERSMLRDGAVSSDVIAPLA
jgi:hypothetical protein